MSHKHHNNNYTHYSKPQETAPVVEPEVKQDVEPEVVNAVIDEPVVTPTVDPVVVDEPVVTPTVDPEVVDPVVDPEPENTEFLGVVTDCVKLNVRKEPNMEADIVTTLLVGTEVMVDKAASTEEFYKITTETGVEGYCKKDYISI